jgi:hypothetical protein
MDYNGLRLSPEVDKTKALALYGAIKTLAKPIKGSELEVSRRLNNGDYAGAERYVKKQIDTDVKANYGDKAIMTGDLEQAKGNTDKLLHLINTNLDKI